MAFEVATELAQLQQIFGGKKPGLGPGGIEQRGSVAFGQNEPVVIVEMWMFRIITHVPEEQRGHDVSRRTARGGMPAACGGGCADRMNPQLIGNALQTFNVNIVHECANICGNREKESRSYWPLYRVTAGARVSPALKHRTSNIQRSIKIQAPTVSRALFVNGTLRFGSSLDVECWMLDVGADHHWPLGRT